LTKKKRLCNQKKGSLARAIRQAAAESRATPAGTPGKESRLQKSHSFLIAKVVSCLHARILVLPNKRPSDALAMQRVVLCTHLKQA